MSIINVISQLLIEWSIPQALSLTQYIHDGYERAVAQVKCHYMTLKFDIAYSLVKAHSEKFKILNPKLYSLIVSIYRYRYSNKFHAGKKLLPSHQMIAYLFPPLVCKNSSDVDLVLAKYEVAVKWLAQQKPNSLPLYIQQLVPASYHLSYLGRDLSHIFKLRNDSLKKYFPLSQLVQPKLVFNLSFETRINIGFISSNFIANHSVMRDRLGVIQNLPRSKYNVYILEITPSSDIDFGQVIRTPLYQYGVNVEAMALCISQLELDILFYCDIGMDGITYQLASHRLATRQMTTWGHSDTSGCREIDTYITSKYFIPENTQHIFTEKLVVINSLSTYYTPLPHLIHQKGFFGGVKPFQRKHIARNILKSLDIPQLSFGDEALLLIGSTAQKVTHTFVPLLDEISDWLPKNGKLLLPSGTSTTSHEARTLHNMYKKLRADGKDKIHIIPPLDPITYSLLVGACDVFLDTFPFGCCNSVLECFAMGVPFVTYPSKFQYGNFVRGFINYTGSKLLTTLIVDSTDSYIEKVDEILNSENLQNDLSTELLTSYPKLLQDKATLEDYDKVFSGM